MSSATTSSALDPATQWASLPDTDISLENVEHLLKPVQDDLWVSAACVDRILDDPTVQQALLDLGIERTAGAVGRAQSAARGSAFQEDDAEEEIQAVGGNGPLRERAQHASLVSYFSGEAADAQMCRIRSLLLERLDRLNTWMQLCKEAPAEEESDEEVG